MSARPEFRRASRGRTRERGDCDQRRVSLEKGSVVEVGCAGAEFLSVPTENSVQPLFKSLPPGAGVELLGTIRSKLLDGFGLPAQAWRVAA